MCSASPRFSISASLTAMVYTLGDISGATFALGAIGEFIWRGRGVAEAVRTFVLCYVVLSVAVSKRTEASHMFDLAIGSCVKDGSYTIGGISAGICILLLVCTGGPWSQNLCSPVAARAGFQVLCGTDGVDYLGAALAYSRQQQWLGCDAVTESQQRQKRWTVLCILFVCSL